MTLYTFRAVSPRQIVVSGQTVSFRRFEVIDRKSGSVFGVAEECVPRVWSAVLPNGRRTEFALPSRKQVAEWLIDASRDSESSLSLEKGSLSNG